MIKIIIFFMAQYIGTDFMNPQLFDRIIDTKDKNIYIPKYIDDLDYNYWK